MRCLLALALCLPTMAPRAQGGAWPDLTDAFAVVPLGRVQVEAGAWWWRDGGSVLTGPEVLVRWAPASRFELRLGAPTYVHAEPEPGFTDATLGVKAVAGPISGWDLAAIATVLIPAGHPVHGTGRPDPALLVSAGRDVRAPVSLEAHLGAAWDTGARRLGFAATLGLGVDVSERGIATLQLTGSELGRDVRLVLVGSYAYAVGRRVQALAHAGAGLTGSGPAVLLGGGLAVRP